MVLEPERLEAAVRAWTTSPSDRYRKSPYAPWTDPVGPSEWVLVFDCETFTDQTQQLRFGCARLYAGPVLHRALVFYDPESVTDEELDVLKQAAADNGWELTDVSEWIEEVFFAAAVDLSATVVGHNLFFDLTRIAIGHDTTRSRDPRMRDGLSLKLTDDPTRPRVLVKKVSSSATFIQFTVPDGRSPEQRAAEKGYRLPPFRGFFADTASLGNSLLGGKWSLARLAKALGTKHQKLEVDIEGPITFEMVDYCMNDVTVTSECFDILKARYDSYHLDVPLHRIFSEASVGKAHLAQMGLRPWRKLDPDFPDWLIAILMETYYGGRTECHIRRQPTPGVYVDFLSQYPTVYCLQNLWHFQIAQTINWEEANPDEINAWIERIGPEDLLQAETWLQLASVVQVDPDGDRLLTRARFKPMSPLFNVGIAERHGEKGWWTLADVISAKLESPGNKTPKITGAIRFTPGQIQNGLRPIDIAGRSDFSVDPYEQDFIQRIIELRTEAKRTRDQATGGGERELWEAIQYGLKITANTDAYGIGIEINTTTHRKPVKAILHRTDGTSEPITTKHSEREGSWFNPVIATLTAAGGRLLLALLIRLVRDAGGDYVFCDTDSLFITGLSTSSLQSIIDDFEALNHYNPAHVPGSILEIEKINYDPDTGELRTIHAYSIASKRYALFTQEFDGTYRLARERNAKGELVGKRSEHGLGHLVPPKQDYEDELWEWIVNADTGNDWPKPDWFDQPALGRITINTPHDLQLFRHYNEGKPYRDQIRPGGFITIAHPHPIEQRGLLLAPFTKEPTEALRRDDWIDRATGESGLRIRTDKPEQVLAGAVAVLDYRHYTQQYMSHREWKTRSVATGTLIPRAIRPRSLARIGKESAEVGNRIPVDGLYSSPERIRTCETCLGRLTGRQRRWCSEACRARRRRLPRHEK